MPATYAWFMLSGGASNGNPQLSLGGPVSGTHGGILVSQQAVLLGADTLPGLIVIGGHNNPIGNGTAQYNYSTGVFTWTDAGANVYTQTIGGDGYYSFSTLTSTLLFHVVTSMLPTGTNSCQYNINKSNQNLFDSLVFSERSANHTNYRCVYLYNAFPHDLFDVTISLVQPDYGTISIGSEYLSALGAVMPQGYAETSAVTWKGSYKLAAYSPRTAAEPATEWYGVLGPYLWPSPPTSAVVQNSDGISVEIPLTIADETDSGGALSAVTWRSSLLYPQIDQGKYISFWIRRYVPAGATGSSQIADDFTLQLIYRRD